MSERRPVRLVRPGDRVEGDATPGMRREEAVAVEGSWAGVVTTDAGATSGWHHHGDHDSTIYVVTGALRMESGPGGADVAEAGPGDFVFVPKGVVHREANPGTAASELVVFRSGTGPVVVNVDGPEP